MDPYCIPTFSPTIRSQPSRTVNHLEMASMDIIDGFLHAWCITSIQRIDWMIGCYEPYDKFPMGVKVVIEAIHEPLREDEHDGLSLGLEAGHCRTDGYRGQPGRCIGVLGLGTGCGDGTWGYDRGEGVAGQKVWTWTLSVGYVRFPLVLCVLTHPHILRSPWALLGPHLLITHPIFLRRQRRSQCVRKIRPYRTGERSSCSTHTFL